MSTIPQSTTPRTDEHVEKKRKEWENSAEWLPAFSASDFNEMAQLETELTAAKAECERLTKVANNRQDTIDLTEAQMGGLRQGEGYWDMVRRVVSSVDNAQTEFARLRAEVENLKTDLFLALRQVNIPAGFWGRAASRYQARAEKAEAEVERLTTYLKTANDNHEKFERKFYIEQDRAERAEAEILERAAMMRDVMRERDALAKDKARLDWLEKEALQQDWGPWSMDRATIDAAMKESIEVPDSVSIEARNPTGGIE